MVGWGFNDNGQLGTGNYTSSNVPVPVVSITGVTKISAGRAHSLAIRADGTIWSWGRNNDGQLGNGTYTSSTVPVQATIVSDMSSIAAAEAHSLARKSDATDGPGETTATGNWERHQHGEQHPPADHSALSCTERRNDREGDFINCLS